VLRHWASLRVRFATGCALPTHPDPVVPPSCPRLPCLQYASLCFVSPQRPPPSNAVAVTVAVASLHCAAPRLCLGAMSSISHPPSAILIPLTPAHPRPNYALSPTVVSAPVRPHPSASRGIVQQRGCRNRFIKASLIRSLAAPFHRVPCTGLPSRCALQLSVLCLQSALPGFVPSQWLSS